MKRPQNWNRYAYVQDNPSNFTDPTGNVVDLSPLSPGQRARLYASLAALTGDTYDVDKNNLLTVVSLGDRSSKAASLFVRELIDSSDTYLVKAENGNPGFNFAANPDGRREIWLDFSEKWLNSGHRCTHRWPQSQRSCVRLPVWLVYEP